MLRRLLFLLRSRVCRSCGASVGLDILCNLLIQFSFCLGRYSLVHTVHVKWSRLCTIYKRLMLRWWGRLSLCFGGSSVGGHARCSHGGTRRWRDSTMKLIALARGFSYFLLLCYALLLLQEFFGRAKRFGRRDWV